MATRFIVRCLGRGATKVDLAKPGRTPERAVWAAQRDKIGRNAVAYVVYERKTGSPVYTTRNWY